MTCEYCTAPTAGLTHVFCTLCHFSITTCSLCHDIGTDLCGRWEMWPMDNYDEERIAIPGINNLTVPVCAECQNGLS